MTAPDHTLISSKTTCTGGRSWPFRRRERVMLRFQRMRSLQKFATVHASVYNLFNSERSLYSRSKFKLTCAAALVERRGLCVK